MSLRICISKDAPRRISSSELGAPVDKEAGGGNGRKTKEKLCSIHNHFVVERFVGGGS